MKRLTNKILCVFIVLFFLDCRVFGQRFNTDAVNGFWHIVDQMEADHPLTDTLWNAYYNLYGNKNYIEKNRNALQTAEHRQYLEWVFRPSMKDSLAKAGNSNKDPLDDILKNLLYIRSNEKELRLYAAKIASDDYLATCIALAKSNLPAGKLNTIPTNLVIYINAMTFDAAVQPPNMYFGLSIVYEFDRFQKGTIAAHEFHHQLRVNREIDQKVSPADSTSFSIINQINNEGTADLVDKTIAVRERKTLYDAGDLLHWLFDSATNVINKLDSSFLINAQESPAHVSYRDFRKMTLYSSGHIPGFYMSNVILRNGYKRQLILHADNPFYIFYLYDKAAKKDKERPLLFSQATMSYLKDLEKKIYSE